MKKYYKYILIVICGCLTVALINGIVSVIQLIRMTNKGLVITGVTEMISDTIRNIIHDAGVLIMVLSIISTVLLIIAVLLEFVLEKKPLANGVCKISLSSVTIILSTVSIVKLLDVYNKLSISYYNVGVIGNEQNEGLSYYEYSVYQMLEGSTLLITTSIIILSFVTLLFGGYCIIYKIKEED